MRKPKRLGLAALVLITLFGVTTVAVAQQIGRPSVEQTEATTIVFRLADVLTRTCVGRDGVEYADERVRAFGTATGDPRLSGSVILNLTRNLVNLETGESVSIGTLKVFHPDAPQGVAVRARTMGDAGVGEIGQGSLIGRARGHGALFANWRTTFHENGAVTAQIGGVAPDGRMPAVIVKGGCTGGFQNFQVVIPAPDASAASRSVSSRLHVWGNR